MTSLRLCRFTLVLGMVAGAALGQPGNEGSAPGGLRHSRLYSVVSNTMFNEVNRNDAPALKVWLDVVGQQRGFVLDTKVDIVNGAVGIRERLVSHSADLMVMGITDYLELESSHLAVPVLADARSAQSGALYSDVLLVPPSSGTTTLAGLRGKSILVSQQHAGKTASAWLDVLLSAEKLGRAGAFFGSVKVSGQAQACILPLFFGAADACVVDEISLNLAKEMNPQSGQLRVLVRSRLMIEGIIAVPTEPAPYQKELIESMLSLNESPRGRQLLMVFKTEHLVRIQPGDLESARELWKAYYQVTGGPLKEKP
jgi:ABC-type phosphate/phosphonate transport system substrate-binding protein